jgi:RNA polymerase sigma-70 factor (ECF subfamily)
MCLIRHPGIVRKRAHLSLALAHGMHSVNSVAQPAHQARGILSSMQSLAAANDEELLRRFTTGQASAFDELYRRHEMRVFRYLLRNLRNRALAEDALQETWFAVARDAARFRSKGARFTTWLFTIAHHRMIDLVRAGRATIRIDTLEPGLQQALPGQTDAEEPYTAAVALDQWQALQRALAALPEEQRQAFLLQQEGEMSVEDIAAVCGCSFETAKSRLRYARSKLREQLQDCL